MPGALFLRLGGLTASQGLRATRPSPTAWEHACLSSLCALPTLDAESPERDMASSMRLTRSGVRADRGTSPRRARSLPSVVR